MTSYHKKMKNYKFINLFANSVDFTLIKYEYLLLLMKNVMIIIKSILLINSTMVDCI